MKPGKLGLGAKKYKSTCKFLIDANFVQPDDALKALLTMRRHKRAVVRSLQRPPSSRRRPSHHDAAVGVNFNWLLPSHAWKSFV